MLRNLLQVMVSVWFLRRQSLIQTISMMQHVPQSTINYSEVLYIISKRKLFTLIDVFF